MEDISGSDKESRSEREMEGGPEFQEKSATHFEAWTSVAYSQELCSCLPNCVLECQMK